MPSKSKHGCSKGQRYSKKHGKCLTPCKKPTIRRSTPPYACYTPKHKARKCFKSISGRKRYFIKSANRCMFPCSKSMRRSLKSPFKCYTPKRR